MFAIDRSFVFVSFILFKFATGWYIGNTGTDVSLPTSGLVLYYPLNGTFQDYSGNGNDGMAVNSPSFVHCNQNESYYDSSNPQCAYFDGSLSQYVEASSTQLPSGERTVSLWLNSESTIGAGSSGSSVAFSYGGGSCGTSFFLFFTATIFYAAPHCEAAIISFAYNTSDLSQTPINNWIHWVTTTSSQNGTTFYLNGKLVAQTSTYVDDTDVSGKELSLAVTTASDGTAPYTDGNVGYYTGLLGEVRVYNRELTSNEINQLFEYQFGSSFAPTNEPTSNPTLIPSTIPSGVPSTDPSGVPTNNPTSIPTDVPTGTTQAPTGIPSMNPSQQPSKQPSGQPSILPSMQPSTEPSQQPSIRTSAEPSIVPSSEPTNFPTTANLPMPSMQPTDDPTDAEMTTTKSS